MDRTQIILERVRAERRRQDAKWGADRQHDDGTWLKIIVEEVGEVAEAMLERDRDNLAKELVQVAATAVCTAEALHDAKPAGVRKVLYLAGPIAGCSDQEARGWRDDVAALYPHVLNPMDRDYRGKEIDAEAVRAIVEGDKADIDRADAVLVWFVRPSVGTSMEILYAYQTGKPVVVIDMSGGLLSPWIVYHASAVVGGIAEAFEFLGIEFGGAS